MNRRSFFSSLCGFLAAPFVARKARVRHVRLPTVEVVPHPGVMEAQYGSCRWSPGTDMTYSVSLCNDTIQDVHCHEEP